MKVNITNKVRPILVAVSIMSLILFLPKGKNASAFDIMDAVADAASIGSAYMTHLFFHEMGHQIVADEVGVESHQMKFFTSFEGSFYPGVSIHTNIPKASKLSHAAGGERMAGHTFEFALQSYRRNPTTFNKALMFFSNVDFFTYTLMANYIHPDRDTYDANIIRNETGVSKELLLSLVTTKMLLNAYRIWNEDANFVPFVQVDRTSASLMIRFDF